MAGVFAPHEIDRDQMMEMEISVMDSTSPSPWITRTTPQEPTVRRLESKVADREPNGRLKPWDNMGLRLHGLLDELARLGGFA
jgi:hypothetical protein